MSRYRKVDTRLWVDAKFRGLSEQAKILWLYFLTGPDTTILPGVLIGGPAHFSEVLGWPSELFAKRFKELFIRGMAKDCFESRLVWLPNAIKYNAPPNPNVVVAWAKAWDEVPECDLKHEIFCEYKPFVEGLGEGFAKRFGEWFAEPSRNRMPIQDQDQDQDQDSGTGTGTGTGTDKRDARESEGGDAVELPLAPAQSFTAEATGSGPNHPEPPPSEPDSGTTEKTPELATSNKVASGRDDGASDDAKSAKDAKTPPKAKRAPKPDLDESDLPPEAKQAFDALTVDESLVLIVPRPRQTATDLIKAAPGVNVAREIAKAGAWLRANPSKTKKNGAAFLLNWVSRAQERGGGGSMFGDRRPANAYRVQQSGIPGHLAEVLKHDQAMGEAERLARRAATPDDGSEI